ncbi:recombinase family protein [Actinomadura sp. KC216]|uniref:recombinase family protein n=1 Tax=Actinomadura sp. KC216 TaxID=2530370 RepID=UPI0010495D43|nr:recombinase family protein [Actinomadura sp. KC216]TDB85603.1 recombinase family protein [Actinomadura sp. KC216]
MIKHAFWGRCSTEDRQDPEASRAWQYSRAEQLITPRDGLIVAEYFDVDKSRSIPPARRPEASRLLEELANPDRGFDAVVVGEPQRAFYGNQFGNTFPLFEHYGVPLWVPEIGGPIDPANEAHDMIMSTFGSISKGERSRIKTRVRSTMAAMAQTTNRHIGGRPPYGYRLVDAGPHPNPSKAADGKRLHVMDIDPYAAEVVQRIFAEFLDGRGIFAIAERLTADGILSPSAYDRARNRHRSGLAWSKSAIRAILINPRYTGRQVWNKQRKREVLIDVHDVARGHETKMTWNSKDAWVWSEKIVNPPIIDEQTFTDVQQMLAGRGRGPTSRAPYRKRHTYVLRGALFCGICRRRMQSHWINNAAYYRCRFPEEYALANKVQHPRNVYVREDAVVPALDRWLCRYFAPHRRAETINAMLAAHAQAPADDAASLAAQQTVKDCEGRLARYRATLDALDQDSDPSVVAGWIAEAQAQRTAALAQLRQAPNKAQITREEITALINDLGDHAQALQHADRGDKASVYQHLGLRLTYHPTKQTVRAEARLDSHRIGRRSVSEEGLEPPWKRVLRRLSVDP